jgi:hypothetical protein
MNPLHSYRRGMSLCLLALLAAPRAFAAPPAILIEPFDFYDSSIDQRPMVLAAQDRWLKAADAALRQGLGGSLSVIDTRRSRSLIAADAANYAHPSACRSCALDAARKLGARYLFIGSVHKISDLICYMRGELDDARSGKVLLVKSMEVKAATRTMWLRAARAMARSIRHRLADQDGI